MLSILLSGSLPLGLLLLALGLPLLLLFEPLLLGDLALFLALLLLSLAGLAFHASTLAYLQLSLLPALGQFSLDLLLPTLVGFLLLRLGLLPLERGKPTVLFVNLQATQVLIDLSLFEVEVATDLLKLLGLDGGGDEVLDLVLLVLDKVVLVLSERVLVVALRSRVFLLLFMIVISLGCSLLIIVILLLAIAASAVTAILLIAMITTMVVITMTSRLVATATTASTIASTSSLIATFVPCVLRNCAKVVASVIVTIVVFLAVSIGGITRLVVGVWLLVAISTTSTATKVRTAALLMLLVVLRPLLRRLGISCCGCLYLLSR